MTVKKSEIVKYKKATQEELDKAFLHSCIYAKFEHIKYLLTSPELKRHANVHAEEDLGFAHLLGNKEKSRNIIQYLIFDFNIERNSIIDEILGYPTDSAELANLKENIKKMFEQRGLIKSLNNELEKNNNNVKKIKI